MFELFVAVFLGALCGMTLFSVVAIIACTTKPVLFWYLDRIKKLNDEFIDEAMNDYFKEQES